MLRVRIALALALLVPAQAWADSTVVMRPTGTAKKRDVDQVIQAVKTKVAALDGFVLSDIDAGSTCAIDPICLASAGRDDGVTKVVGINVSKLKSGFVVLFMAVDATTGAELARHEIRGVSKKRLSSVAARGLLDFAAKMTQPLEVAPLEVAPLEVEPPEVEPPLVVDTPAVEVVDSPVEEPVADPPPIASVAKKAARDSSQTNTEKSAGNELGLGISVGQPTRLSARYRLPVVPLALEVGVGSGVMRGMGLHVDANLSYESDLGPLQLAVGAGYRHYAHHYDPGSIDELDSDVHQGVHGVLGVSYPLGALPLDLFADFAAGYDWSQSASCTFMSGVNTVCPHQDESRVYLNLGLGARYWIKM